MDNIFLFDFVPEREERDDERFFFDFLEALGDSELEDVVENESELLSLLLINRVDLAPPLCCGESMSERPGLEDGE